MAIDPLTEDLIHPREATLLFPRGLDGKRIHTSAIYRFMSKGARGVVLESLSAPRKCTSKQAVARFIARLSDQRLRAVQQENGVDAGKAHRDVERELDRHGF